MMDFIEHIFHFGHILERPQETKEIQPSVYHLHFIKHFDAHNLSGYGRSDYLYRLILSKDTIHIPVRELMKINGQVCCRLNVSQKRSHHKIRPIYLKSAPFL